MSRMCIEMTEMIDTPETGLKRHALNGATMGTRYSALFYCPPDRNIEPIQSDLFAAVDRVDCQMSTWKAESDLMRINDAAPGVWIDIPADLAFVLERALMIGRESDGAFDIGVGNIVNAWGFGATNSAPDPDEIRAWLGKAHRAAHEVIELDVKMRRVRKHAPISLDLSGIAKGFGVDQMVACLAQHGIHDALVGLDGELGARGTTPDGRPWVIAVEKPDYHRREPTGILHLTDKAVATSGDYRHWVDVGAMRLSHTIDRRLGGPIRNQVASVTVVTDHCIDADGWATALMVAGVEDGLALARRKGLSALFILRDGENLAHRSVGEVFAPLTQDPIGYSMGNHGQATSLSSQQLP